MSIEYFASSPSLLSDRVVEAIRSAIRGNDVFAIVRDTETVIGLRRKDTSLTVEHATLQITVEGLYIAFHAAATLAQQESLLGAIQQALDQLGLQFAWQEL